MTKDEAKAEIAKLIKDLQLEGITSETPDGKFEIDISFLAAFDFDAPKPEPSKRKKKAN